MAKNPASEIAFPVADPNDPYAMPAAMPSSADRSVRSFEVCDFEIPARTQEEWRFTPVERFSEFFEVFDASGTTSVTVSTIDGSPYDEDAVEVLRLDRGAEPAGCVSKPTDRAAAIAWNCAAQSNAVIIKESLTSTLLIRVHGWGWQLDALHLVIQARDNVSADVVIEHDGQARLAQGVEVLTGAFSNVSTTFVHEWEQGSKQVGNHRIRVGREATLRHTVVTLGGQAVRIRMDQDFAGANAQLNMLGMYCVDPGEHIEHRTMVTHNHPDCRSRVIYKGSLSGKGAHSTWVGNALIQASAPGTDSYELNRNLVLSPGAVADSEPNLEIENGNIIGAGHASSVGRFDDEELFYLQSRGIPEAEARKLVVRGFFQELVDEIGVDEISEHLMNTIDRRLAQGESANAVRS